MYSTDLLIVIEAPGKIAALSRALAEIRVSAAIRATGGGLFNLPRRALGLDPASLLPNEWVPEKQRNIDELIKGLDEFKRVVIMTDADIEGELIASQVNAVLRKAGFAGIIQRASSTSLAPAALQAALASPRDIDRSTCVHAIARRAIDRGVGFLLSDTTTNFHAIAGRIRAQILSSIAERPLNTYRVTGLHAIDPAWRIHAQGSREQQQSLAALLAAFHGRDPELFSRATTRKITRPAPPPPTGPESILMIANKLGIPVKEAELLLQRNYEAGRTSYPRTDSARYSLQTQHWLKGASRLHNLRPRSSALDGDEAEMAQGGHEALYPLDVKPATGESLNGMPRGEAAQILVSRRALAAVCQDAVVQRTQVPNQAIREFLDRRHLPPVSAAIWKDAPDTAGWLMLDRGMLHVARVESIPTDHAILGRLIEDRIGRPSTAVKIASGISERGLVVEGGLSRGGWSNLHHIDRTAPSLLGDHNLDAFLESLGTDDLDLAIHQGYVHLGLSSEDMVQRALNRASADLDQSTINPPENLTPIPV